MSFLNVIEIESALAGLASTYPTLAQLVALPYGTVEGRICHALVIGTGETCPQTSVLILGGTHAREWGSPDICVYFAADLVAAYAAGSGLGYGGTVFSAAQIKSIVRKTQVIVVPDINPDGRHYSQTTYAMWRKNRNPASSGGQANRIGVDVNRNYDFLWNFGVAFAPGALAGGTLASADPADNLFHGTAPFSEAETKNVRWLFDTFPHIHRFVDVHSYGGDVLHPWGDDENQWSDTGKNFTNAAWNGKRGLVGDAYGEYIGPCNHFRHSSTGHAMATAIEGVRGEHYEVDQSFFLPSWSGPSYPTSGASDDWAFSRHLSDPRKAKTRAFTIEFNRTKTFFPTWTEMEKIIRDIDAGLVALCLSTVPAFTFPSWFCRLGRWWFALWRRVFPPDLWGPYGPWGRLRRILEVALYAVIGPLMRTSRRRQ